MSRHIEGRLVTRSYPQVDAHLSPVVVVLSGTQRSSGCRRLERLSDCDHQTESFLFKVAKHYMTSRSSFNDTARYWTEIYAGGPASKTAASASAAEPKDEVAIAGLEKAHVDQFEALGFERSKVVSLIASLVPPLAFSHVRTERRLTFSGE